MPPADARAAQGKYVSRADAQPGTSPAEPDLNVSVGKPLRGFPTFFCQYSVSFVRKEQNMVPVLSMVFMAVSLILAAGLPIILCIWLRTVKKADLLPFFAGCGVMLLSAFVLEQIAHTVILGSPAGSAIKGNIWLYALYGGAMAALFEESGRYLAFRTVLKKYLGRDINALMYGAGHGGLEAMVILGIASLNNLITSVMINSGGIQALMGTLPADAAAQVETAVETLKTTPSGLFLMGGIERISAVILQISLSVLVWTAVKHREKRMLFPAALLIHFAVDACTVILSQMGVSMYVLEAIVGIMALLSAAAARIVWGAGRTDSRD